MALEIQRETTISFPDEGWGVVGEKLGDPTTEVLGEVFDLEEKKKAKDLTGSFEASRIGELSWFTIRVTLCHVGEDGTARYTEASDLTHAGEKY